MTMTQSVRHFDLVFAVDRGNYMSVRFNVYREIICIIIIVVYEWNRLRFDEWPRSQRVTPAGGRGAWEPARDT